MPLKKSFTALPTGDRPWAPDAGFAEKGPSHPSVDVCYADSHIHKSPLATLVV